MSLTGRIQVGLSFDDAVVADLGQSIAEHRKSTLIALLDGSGAGQVNKIWSDSGSQIQSVNTDLDLSGSLAGRFGAVVFTAIKGIAIFAGSANPGNLIVGNVTNGIVAPFGAATHSQAVAPGGLYVNVNPSAAGFPIVAATADLLRIASAATAGTYTYDVMIVGIG